MTSPEPSRKVITAGAGHFHVWNLDAPDDFDEVLTGLFTEAYLADDPFRR